MFGEISMIYIEFGPKERIKKNMYKIVYMTPFYALKALQFQFYTFAFSISAAKFCVCVFYVLMAGFSSKSQVPQLL